MRRRAWLYALTGEFLLGRAPAHALFIGFFGSLLVAMVTRVTQGHSGRPLVMPAVAWFAFVAIQLVCADCASSPSSRRTACAWQAVAAIGWLLAFAPWVLRSAAHLPVAARRRQAGLSDARPMIEFYPQIKCGPHPAVCASGSLFALRGALRAGRRALAAWRRRCAT